MSLKILFYENILENCNTTIYNLWLIYLKLTTIKIKNKKIHKLKLIIE